MSRYPPVSGRVACIPTVRCQAPSSRSRLDLSRHRGQTQPLLWVAAVLILVALIVALAPKATNATAGNADFAKVRVIIAERCVSCHAAQPTQAGFAQPPKGVVLETAEQIRLHAAKINETVASRYMPIGNLTQMTVDERQRIAAWFGNGAKAR